MIYEIETFQLPLALQKKCNVLAISVKGLSALVNNLEDPSGLNIINTYEDSDYGTLIASEFWKQPCKDC